MARLCSAVWTTLWYLPMPQDFTSGKIKVPKWASVINLIFCSGYVADRVNLRYFLTVGIAGKYDHNLNSTKKHSHFPLPLSCLRPLLCTLTLSVPSVPSVPSSYPLRTPSTLCTLCTLSIPSPYPLRTLPTGSGIVALLLGLGYFFQAHHLAYFIVFQILAGFMQVQTQRQWRDLIRWDPICKTWGVERGARGAEALSLS